MIENEIIWLNEFYKTSSTASNAKDIYPLISGIRCLFKDKDYETVDIILKDMDYSKLSHVAMVAFLTSTFPARSKLDNWNSSINKVDNYLKKDGLDSKSILQGLL